MQQMRYQSDPQRPTEQSPHPTKCHQWQSLLIRTDCNTVLLTMQLATPYHVPLELCYTQCNSGATHNATRHSLPCASRAVQTSDADERPARAGERRGRRASDKSYRKRRVHGRSTISVELQELVVFHVRTVGEEQVELERLVQEIDVRLLRSSEVARGAGVVRR